MYCNKEYSLSTYNSMQHGNICYKQNTQKHQFYSKKSIDIYKAVCHSWSISIYWLPEIKNPHYLIYHCEFDKLGIHAC